MHCVCGSVWVLGRLRVVCGFGKTPSEVSFGRLFSQWPPPCQASEKPDGVGDLGSLIDVRGQPSTPHTVQESLISRVDDATEGEHLCREGVTGFFTLNCHFGCCQGAWESGPSEARLPKTHEMKREN